MKRFILVALLCLSGCSTTLTQAELDKADYGYVITQESAERAALQFLHSYLKDPASALCEWKPIYKGGRKDGLIDGNHSHFGYILDGKVNAKNSYGGYIGYKDYEFIFNNGQIKAIYSDITSGSTEYFGKIY